MAQKEVKEVVKLLLEKHAEDYLVLHKLVVSELLAAHLNGNRQGVRGLFQDAVSSKFKWEPQGEGRTPLRPKHLNKLSGYSFEDLTKLV